MIRANLYMLRAVSPPQRIPQKRQQRWEEQRSKGQMSLPRGANRIGGQMLFVAAAETIRRAVLVDTKTMHCSSSPDSGVHDATSRGLQSPMGALLTLGGTTDGEMLRGQAGRNQITASVPSSITPIAARTMVPMRCQWTFRLKYYNIPPTAATRALVPTLTGLCEPCHGCACVHRCLVSSPSRWRKAGDDVARTKESSVSRLADREFRFVEPKTVRYGSAVSVGRNQMPAAIVLEFFTAKPT